MKYRLIFILGVMFSLATHHGPARAAGADKLDPRTLTTLDISKPTNGLAPVTPQSTPAEIANAIQARLDFLNDHRLEGRVFLPPGTWQISRPIFMNGDNKELVGGGMGQTILAAADGYLAMPMINAGTRTDIEQRPLQAGNRVPLSEGTNRVHDASVAGHRFGLRTCCEYPSNPLSQCSHHVAVKDPKPWGKGASYKVNDAVDPQLPAAPGPSLAVCVRDHVASDRDQPGKGKDWQQFWVIQVPAHVQVVGDPLANGAYDPSTARASDWETMDHFVLDFGFVQNAPAEIYDGRRMLCGVIMGNPDRPTGRVWRLMLSGKGLLTFDLPLADGTARSIELSHDCQRPGAYRVSLQLDFPTHTLQAWICRPGETELARTCNDSGQIPEHRHFQRVEYGYFIIAAGGDSAPAGSNGRLTPALDMTVFGLHTSAELRYADSERLVRRDNRMQADDNFRYFSNTPGTLAFLPLTDLPGETDSQTSRLLVTIEHGDAAGDAHQKGYGLLKVPLSIWGMTRPRISDMTIRPGPVWGAGILTWHTLDMQLSNLDIRGGFYAVGDLFYGAQYTFSIDHCILSGSEAAFNGSSNILEMQDVTIDPVGRCGILLSGSNAQLKHVTFVNPQLHHSDYYFRHIGTVPYGGLNLLSDVHGDAPAGSAYPSRAAISQQTIPYAKTCLVVQDCSAANMGPQAAFIELPFHPFAAHAVILAGRCAYQGHPIAAWLRCDSPYWTGRFTGFDPHAPVAKYATSSPPAFEAWQPKTRYHPKDHAAFAEQAWESLDENISSPPGAQGSAAHWKRLISSIIFEPGTGPTRSPGSP